MKQSLVSINKQMIHLGFYVKAKEIYCLCESVKQLINQRS